MKALVGLCGVWADLVQRVLWGVWVRVLVFVVVFLGKTWMIEGCFDFLGLWLWAVLKFLLLLRLTRGQVL